MSAPVFGNPQIHYVIELQHAGLDVRMQLNDIEILRGAQTDKKIVSQKVNGWLTGMTNELVLSAAIPDPANINSPLDLKCLIFRGPHGRQPEESEALDRFAQRDKTKLPAGAMQVVWRTSFTADPYYGPWRWESGRAIAQDGATAAAAIQIVQAVVTALNAHNTAALIDLFRFQIEESARAYGLESDVIQDQLVGWSNSWVTSPASLVQATDYSLTIEASQRLLRVRRKDGKPVFATDPRLAGSGPTCLYLVAPSEGWAIVR